MLTSKQRSNLTALSSKLEPVMQIGKGGITRNLTAALSEALEARELIKITVLDSAGQSPGDLARKLSAELNAQTVKCIGKKIILYRKSQKQDFEHIEF